MYEYFFKRFLDFTLSVIGLVVFSPLLLVLTILLVFANGGKVLFTQDRPGKNNKIFRLVKFKTMNDRRDADGKLLPDKDRLTPIGRFIRYTSIYILPQLINGFE